MCTSCVERREPATLHWRDELHPTVKRAQWQARGVGRLMALFTGLALGATFGGGPMSRVISIIPNR